MRAAGGDVLSNSNERLRKGQRTRTFPVLTELAQIVEITIASLGYDPKVKSEMTAALLTRLNGLRTGGKGAMLDVQRSIPLSWLLKQRCVFELEGLGDDDDKAFVMGLLLIRLAEYRRANGPKSGLEHVLVVEEAHRLLTNSKQGGTEEQANPRAKAVETFANLLAEVRAYGQGMIIVDQVPVKLASDVIKNTNLKIAHRLVAEDDRVALGDRWACLLIKYAPSRI